MAITVYTKDDVRFLWGEQATWGTALASTADYNGTTPEWGEILDCEIVAVDGDQQLREPNRSDTGVRYLRSDNFNYDIKGASAKVTITGDAKKATLASFLYAVIQNVSEAVGSPFEKTYTFSATQPDFTAGNGFFGTFVVDNPGAEAQKLKDVICNELVLTCNPNDGQGRMQMVANMMARGGITETTSSESGVHARYAQTFFYFHDLKTCTVGGSAVVPLGIEIRIRNNATPIGTDNSGNFLTYAITKYEVEAKINAVWDSVSLALQQTSHTGSSAPTPVILTWGTDDNDGYLNWTIYGTTMKSPDIYDPVKGIELNFRGSYNGTNAPLTVVLADAIDRGW